MANPASTPAVKRREIRPQEGPQEAFLRTPADIAIYGGAAGGGKTFALLLEGLRNISNPLFSGVIFRRTMKQIVQEGGIWDESTTIYPAMDAKPNLTSRFWTFPSGASISFAGLEHEHDKLDFQGAQLAFIGFDELTHFTEGQFFYLLSRNRSMSGIKGYIRATCNPGPGWVKRLLAPWVDRNFPNKAESGEIRWFKHENNRIIWLDEAPPDRGTCDDGEEGDPCLKEDCERCFPPEKSITFIRASVFDNKELLKKDPGYVTNLMNLPEYEKLQLLRGEWDAQLPHLVLDQFVESVHKIPYRTIPSSWRRRYLGADFGGVNTAGVVAAEDPDSGDIIVFGEDWAGHSRSWKQIASDFVSICGMTPKAAYGGNRTGEQGWRQSLRVEGLPFLEPDQMFADMKMQYQNVNDLFSRDQLFITENCVDLLSMIQSFQRPIDKDGKPEDKIDDEKFHLCAALRYLCTGLRPPQFTGGEQNHPRVKIGQKEEIDDDDEPRKPSGKIVRRTRVRGDGMIVSNW